MGKDSGVRLVLIKAEISIFKVKNMFIVITTLVKIIKEYFCSKINFYHSKCSGDSWFFSFN